MRYPDFLPALALLGLLAACSDGPTRPTIGAEAVTLSRAMSVTAAPTRTPFGAYLYTCGGAPPEDLRVTDGGTLHFHGAGNDNRWISDSGNPLIDGREINEVDLNLNLKNGVGLAHGSSTLTPDAGGGTWNMRFHVDVQTGESWGAGHGTGELRDMSIEWTGHELTDGPAGPEGCQDQPFARVEGTITAGSGP